jgi:hypothetical protein
MFSSLWYMDASHLFVKIHLAQATRARSRRNNDDEQQLQYQDLELAITW